MSDFPKGPGLRWVLVVVIALASSRVLISADAPGEGRAIRAIVRLGGNVSRDNDGYVTMVTFRHGNDFGDEDFRLLKPFTKLEMLSLQGTQIAGTRVVGSGLNEINGLKQLRRLSLRKTRVGDVGIEQLAGLDLWELDLIGTQITDAGLRVIGKFKRLSSLRLRDTQISDAGLKHLAGLRSLQDLELNGTRVTDSGLKELAGLKELISLDLSNTKVTDAGLKELKGLAIRGLMLNSPGISDAGLKEVGQQIGRAHV